MSHEIRVDVHLMILRKRHLLAQMAPFLIALFHRALGSCRREHGHVDTGASDVLLAMAHGDSPSDMPSERVTKGRHNKLWKQVPAQP